jgi:hypothetical protein
MTDLGKCLWCGKATQPFKGDQYRKYCSRKCNNAWLHKHRPSRSRYVKKNPNWGEATRKRKAELERKKLEYEKHVNSPDWLTLEELSVELDLTPAGGYSAAKAAGISPKIIKYRKGGKGASKHAFYHKEDAAKIIKHRIHETVIPEGYITTRQFAERIGITLATFQSMRSKSNSRPVAKALQKIKWDRKVNIPGGGRMSIWKESCVDDYIKLKKEVQDKSEAARLAKRLAKEEAIAKEQAAYEKAIEGKLTTEEVIAKLGVNNLTTKWTDRLSPIKLKRRVWFDPEDVARAIAQVDLEYSLEVLQRFMNPPKRPHSTVLSHLSKYEAYQERIRNDWATIGPKYPKNIKPDLVSRRIGLVKKAWEDEANGNVLHMDCPACEKNLPFTHFWVDLTYKSAFRKNCMCCETEQRQQKRKSKSKPPKKQSRKSLFVTCFATSVKQSLSKRNKEYQYMSSRYVWAELENHLGYTKQDFIDHIDKQLDASNWMTYDNWGKPEFPGDKKWQLDHIQPRASFEYKKISDESFKRCWDLSNLAPLEATMNMIKSDKKLRASFNGSLRNALKAVLQGRRVKKSGVWKFVNYTPAELKEHLESKFKDGMTWKNYGEKWQIDHVIPQAALPYKDSHCKNFKKCWDLKNLAPLPRSENSAKNSKYKDKLWHYNDEK